MVLKTAGRYFVYGNLNFRQLSYSTGADKNDYVLRWHMLPVLFAIDQSRYPSRRLDLDI